MNTRATKPNSLSGAVFIIGAAVFHKRARNVTPNQTVSDASVSNTQSTVTPAPEAYIPGTREGLRLLARQPLPVVVLVDTDTSPAPLANVARQRTDTALPQRAPQRERIYEVVHDSVYYYASARGDSRDVSSNEQRHILDQLLRRLADHHGVNLEASVLISDNWADLETGAARGCLPILLMTGQGREQISAPETREMRARTWYAADLVMAALSIEAQVTALSTDPQGDARSA